MPIHALADLAWEQLRQFDPARTVALLPIGALEAHGPHLPLSTDVIIARAMAAAAAERLCQDALTAVLMPPLVYTAAPFAAGFPGTVSADPAAVASQVGTVARTVHAWGWRVLAIANAHLDPAHLQSVRDGLAPLANRNGFAVAFPDLTRRPWAQRLTEEFRSGACHAGCYEGSIVLASRPELVHEEVRRKLPPNPASLSEAIRAGIGTFEGAGGPRAYFGDPASANAQEGTASIAALGQILYDAVRNVIDPSPPAGPDP